MPGTRLRCGIISIAASGITAVYAAGYIHTQAADATLGSVSAVSAAATSAPPQVRPTAAPQSGGPTTIGSFKDGMYSGSGTSRRGDIPVSLVVQNGRVASVNITRATTQYPTRFISSLPGEVASRQNAHVNLVSGATYSSLAFRGTVQQALGRAQA
jgi:uncharacterized protein with FMN-binding domain